MSDTVYIGIDPGVNGGICALIPGKELPVVWDMPNIPSPTKTRDTRIVDASGVVGVFEAISDIIEDLGDWCIQETIKVAIEEQHAFPKQGVVAIWNLAEGFGVLKGVLAYLDIKVEIIPPTEWKKFYFEWDPDRGKDKEISVNYCKKLYPALTDVLTGPKGKKKDGIADAILIASYFKHIKEQEELVSSNKKKVKLELKR